MGIVRADVLVRGAVFHRLATATAGEFPFGFAGQAKNFPATAVQAVDEGVDFGQHHAFHRVIFTVRILGRVVSHDALPLPLGNLVFPQVIIIQTYLVDGHLIVFAIAKGIAHQVAVSLDQYEFHAAAGLDPGVC